jgi:hypothetical protein
VVLAGEEGFEPFDLLIQSRATRIAFASRRSNSARRFAPSESSGSLVMKVRPNAAIRDWTFIGACACVGQFASLAPCLAYL